MGAAIDFQAINRAVLPHLPRLIRLWIPDGRQEGVEWVARNPLRADRHLGSFKINLCTGRWADFATGDRGGDVVSLVAYLRGIRQGDAAAFLAEGLGVRDV